MSKKIYFSFLFIFSSLLTFAQELDPIKWTTTTEKISDTEYNLVYTAVAEKPWVVYSQKTEGATPTAITYETENDIEFVGKSVESGHKKEGPDALFDGAIVIKYLSDVPFVIKQKVRVIGPNPKAIGYLEYMTCDNTKCIGGLEIEFDFDLKGASSSKADKIDNSTGSTSKEIIPDEKVKTVPVKPTKKAVEKKVAAQTSVVKNTPAEKKQAIKINTVQSSNDQIKVSKFSVNTSKVETKNNDILDPIKWTTTSKKISDTEYDLIYTAIAEKPWVAYSQHTKGAEPTVIVYETKNDIELVGESTETGHKKQAKDKLFENQVVIKYLSDQPFIITQRVKITGPNPKAQGYIEYMTCDDTKCIGGLEKDFEFNFGNSPAVASGTDAPANLIGANGFELLDQKRPEIIKTLPTPVGSCGEEDSIENAGLFWTFLMGFVGGLLALLTPCVFPMIPLTVSFFTKDTKRSGLMNGLIYGISIIVIYVALGLLITSFFGAEALNGLATSWIANTIFFVIFIAFAISFFGYYEITLPSSWSTKSDEMADKGGLIGIFFMAFTLALVSFSCTGPIIGSALVQSATNKIGPLVVMLGFSSALALPFGLFAAFPSWLNSLPKSGGWMNSVKVVLGFLEVALAFKFLSVADMVNHWGFLRYELFMGIWVIVFAAMTLYLFGFIKFPHDSRGKLKLSPVRGFFAVASLAWTLYLVTGFFYSDESKSYNSLKLMSGLAPPTNYNYLLDKNMGEDEEKKTYISYTKCANNIDCFKDYYEGLEYAQKHNKPLLVDMTGYGCVNCRKTEEHIWVDPDIKSKLNDDFVLVSLYVDDDKKLDKTYMSANREGKKLRNVGNKWADFQIVNFKKNAQPLYIIVSPDEKIMASPRGFKDGIGGYNQFLDCGLDAFKKKG